MSVEEIKKMVSGLAAENERLGQVVERLNAERVRLVGEVASAQRSHRLMFDLVRSIAGIVDLPTPHGDIVHTDR